LNQHNKNVRMLALLRFSLRLPPVRLGWEWPWIREACPLCNCSCCNRRRNEMQQCRCVGTRVRLRQWIVHCRLTHFVIQTYYRKRSTVQNTSELLSGVSRRVQRYLLTVRNTNFSVLFMATRLVHFVCQSSQNGALFKPEHSISAHKVKWCITAFLLQLLPFDFLHFWEISLRI
jgi:hypothetical protein